MSRGFHMGGAGGSSEPTEWNGLDYNWSNGTSISSASAFTVETICTTPTPKIAVGTALDFSVSVNSGSATTNYLYISEDGINWTVIAYSAYLGGTYVFPSQYYGKKVYIKVLFSYGGGYGTKTATITQMRIRK